MRSVPTALNDELLKEVAYMTHLVEFYFSTPAYYTELDIDIYYDDKHYVSRGMEVGDTKYSLTPEIDTTETTMDNVSKEFSNIVLSEEVRGKIYKLLIAALSYPAKVIATTQIFSGIIDTYKADPKKVVFTIDAPFVLWKRKIPRRKHQATCPWAFKIPGSGCRYAGPATWCDQTYARCAALGNTINFGGDRWLPSLVNKEIWWGKKPTV